MKTIRQGFTYPICTGLALAICGCASMKVEKEQVAQVHKVAIVGFAVDQRMPNTGEGVVKSLLAPKRNDGPMKGLHAAEIGKPAEHAQMMYDELAKTLSNGMAWKVVARDELRNNIDYRAIFDERTKQPQARPFLSGPNMEVFVADGIVEDFLIAPMEPAERAELIRKLGVDAIAEATVHIELINGGGLKTLVGAGDFHPKATLSFNVYDATHKDAIWTDVYADGEPTAEGVEHALGFADVDAVNQQAILATDSAYQKLLARYKSE
jgi:hypothetical protein